MSDRKGIRVTFVYVPCGVVFARPKGFTTRFLGMFLCGVGFGGFSWLLTTILARECGQLMLAAKPDLHFLEQWTGEPSKVDKWDWLCIKYGKKSKLMCTAGEFLCVVVGWRD